MSFEEALYRIVLKVWHKLTEDDPENAHEQALWLLQREKLTWLWKWIGSGVMDHPPIEFCGITFKRPVGLAAGSRR